MGRPFLMERRNDFWLPQLCYSAMRAKAKRLLRLSGIVWTMARTRRKQKAESISPLMNVIRPPWRTSSFGKGQLCRYDGPGTEERKIMCCAIRYDNPSIRARSPPKEANRIGYELAMRWTKGRHAFIVTTHTDKQHIHCHIYYNSTTLDCTRKFRKVSFGAPSIRRSD